MAASLVNLCKGVRDALNDASSGTFSESFTAVFQYVPQYTIPDFETLRVVVSDAGGDINGASRRLIQYVDRVRIVILWRVDSATTTEIDNDLMESGLLLSEEIVEFLFHRPIGNHRHTGEVIRGDGEKAKNHYFPGHLEQGQIFAADLTFAYQWQGRVL